MRHLAPLTVLLADLRPPASFGSLESGDSGLLGHGRGVFRLGFPGGLDNRDMGLRLGWFCQVLGFATVFLS